MEIVKEILAYVFVVAPILGFAGFWLWKMHLQEKARISKLNDAVKAHEDACNVVRCYLYERMRRDEL